MKNKPAKIIIDTNLWISFLITKNYSQFDEIIYGKKCVLIFSQVLLDEFLAVIRRPKFRRFFSRQDTEDLIETIEEHAEFMDAKTAVKVCRDEKDNFLLALSQDSNADFLVTGDSDLLSLQKFGTTKILNVRILK